MHLLIVFSYMTLKLKTTSNELWKGWKLAWYHHFIHIARARKLRGLGQKLDALRVQNGQSLSKYQGFIQKLVCYKGISFFLNIFELHSFSVLKMHHSKPHHKFSTLSDFHRYFSCIYWFFFSYNTLKLKSISNELRKGWKLAWYHHFTHIACARKLRGLRQKLDALHVQNGQSLSKYQCFIRKHICYTGVSFFFKLLELHSFSVLKMHHSKPHH